MKKIIKQMFNRTNSGDIIGGNKTIIEKNIILQNSVSKRVAEELCGLIINNFEKRISMHMEAIKKVVELNESGDPWWLDETDFVFDALHEVGSRLDEEILEAMLDIKKISPVIYDNCRKYIEYEKEKRGVMQTYLIMDGRNGFSFSEKYEKVLKDLKENLEYLREQMVELCNSL